MENAKPLESPEFEGAEGSTISDRVNADNTYAGELAAISLEVTIANATGEALFVESGGIQVVTQISGGAIWCIPEAEYLAKPVKDTRAVEIAFAPLVYKQVAD